MITNIVFRQLILSSGYGKSNVAERGLGYWAQGQEVEFHEIEIQFFHEFKFSIMRSNFNLFMRSNLSKINQEVDTSIMRSKFKKRIIRNFNLMIDLLVTNTIMRSKFKINYSNLVSCICG